MDVAKHSADAMRLPTRWQAFVFEAKAWVFRLCRAVSDSGRLEGRLAPTGSMREAPVLAESVSDLWPHDDDGWILVAGKVHNLRLAARRIDAIVVPAGRVFSFWRQIGRATRRRGYARGRELREGCVVPAIGGGLCQLSNAIYDVALRAGLEIVERHRHSRVMAGSLAERDRDATVFWNYRDLRLRGSGDWRLEVALDADRLVVRIRGESASVPTLPLTPSTRMQSESTGDCTSCGETDCHRHAGAMPATARRVWLLDEDWPEFEAYRRQHWRDGDRIVRVSALPGWRGRAMGLWWRGLRRLRIARGEPLPPARQAIFRRQALACSRLLRPEDTSLVVAQSLLPYLQANGDLGGRRYDVLMSALPMREIQLRLDVAALRHPESDTLRDFRADDALLEAERAALEHAEKWVSPHAGIFSLAGTRGLILPWQLPEVQVNRAMPSARMPRVLLAASALARKGVRELREALKGLDVELLLPPGAEEAQDFWRSQRLRRVESMVRGIEEADVAVLPAWVEHQPRGLLRAIAMGKPVIATSACGLSAELAWIRIDEGDVGQLRDAIERACSFQ